MVKKSKQPDPSQIARHVLEVIVPDTEPPKEKNPAAVALGRLGGLKGGPARKAKLTAEQRKRIAKKAADARWNRNSGDAS